MHGPINIKFNYTVLPGIMAKV